MWAGWRGGEIRIIKTGIKKGEGRRGLGKENGGDKDNLDRGCKERERRGG